MFGLQLISYHLIFRRHTLWILPILQLSLTWTFISIMLVLIECRLQNFWVSSLMRNLIGKSMLATFPKKLTKTTAVLRKASQVLNERARYILYCSIFLPYINYCSEIWEIFTNQTSMPYIWNKRKSSELYAMFII